MQRLEVSCAVRLIYRSLGFKGLTIPNPTWQARGLNTGLRGENPGSL